MWKWSVLMITELQIASTLLLSNYLIREVKPKKYGLPSGMAQFQLVKIVNYKMSPAEMLVGENAMYLTNAFILRLSTLECRQDWCGICKRFRGTPPLFFLFFPIYLTREDTTLHWSQSGQIMTGSWVLERISGTVTTLPSCSCTVSLTRMSSKRDRHFFAKRLDQEELISGYNTELTITQSILRSLPQNIWIAFTKLLTWGHASHCLFT